MLYMTFKYRGMGRDADPPETWFKCTECGVEEDYGYDDSPDECVNCGAVSDDVKEILTEREDNG